MAIELGAAYISILPSTDKLAPAIRKELGAVEREAAASGKRSGGFLAGGLKSGIGKVVGAAGIVGTILGPAAALKGGLDRLMNIDVARSKLRGLGHDAEAIDKIMQSATNSVTGTAYGLGDAATVAAGAVAAGVKEGGTLTKYLKQVADAATIAGVPLNEMGSIFNRVQTQGRAYTMELNMLADRGIPIFQWLADEYGVTQQELRKMVAAGEIDSESYFKAINKNIGGAALQSGETVQGAFANVKAAISRIGAGFLTGLGFADLPDFLKRVQGALGPIEAKAGPMGEKLRDLFAKARPYVSDFIGVLRKTIGVGRDVIGWLNEHRGVVVGVVAVLGTLKAITLAHAAAMKVQAAGGILKFLTSYLTSTKLIQAATKTWAAVQWVLNAAMSANPIGLVVIAIAALVAGFVIAYKRSETFRNIVKGALSAVRSAGVRVADFFRKDIPEAFGKVRSAASSALGWVRSNWPKILVILTGPFGLAVVAIVKNWDKIKKAASATKDWIVDKFNAVVGFFRSMPGKISSATSGLWNGLKDGFRSAVNSIIGWWNNLSFSIPAVKIKGKTIVPGATFSTPNIPYLANGGLLTKATLNVAGEAGPEAVTPLDRLEGWITRAAHIGASNAAARTYDTTATARRTEFVITNWHTGEGYFRQIAEDTVDGADAFAGTTRRMR